MKSIKFLFIYLILTLIIAICKAEIIRRPSSSESSNTETSLRRNYSGRVNAQRPNVAPIRRRNLTKSSDSSKSPAPATTSWREPKPSQPQRELIFLSPQRNMSEKSGTARDHSKKRHFRKRYHKNNSKRTQGLRNRQPNVFPIRPHFTTEKPTAVFRRRNPAFARSSQREHTFISVPRPIRKDPTSARTNLRRNHYNRMRSQGAAFKRTQPSRLRRPNVYPIRPVFTTRKPSASFRHWIGLQNFQSDLNLNLHLM